MLRWIETQLDLAARIGVDLDREEAMGSPLGTIRKYAWMVEGLVRPEAEVRALESS